MLILIGKVKVTIGPILTADIIICYLEMAANLPACLHL